MLSSILLRNWRPCLLPTNYGIQSFTKSLHQEVAAQPEPPAPDTLYSQLEIELRGHDAAVLRSYTTFASMSAENLGIELGNCWSLRKPEKGRLTLLKSVHIYKKHRVQYEVRTYFRYMTFNKLTGSTLSTFLEYIERNLPEGVAMKCTKTALERMPDYLEPQSS